MSRSRAIIELLTKHPGLSSNAISIRLKILPGQMKSLHAALCTMALSGKLTHNGAPPRSGKRVWFAKSDALNDRRRRVQVADAPPLKKKVVARATLDFRRVMVSQMKEKTEPPAVKPAEKETVAEWMARTGKTPEVLKAGATSRQLLRFDHSNPEIPASRRPKAKKRKESRYGHN